MTAPRLELIVTPSADEDLAPERLRTRVGEFVESLQGVRLELGVADADGVPLPFDIDFSSSPAFRMQAMAVFPKHEVIGQTRAIPRAEFYDRMAADWDLWERTACIDLIEKLTGGAQ